MTARSHSPRASVSSSTTVLIGRSCDVGFAEAGPAHQPVRALEVLDVVVSSSETVT